MPFGLTNAPAMFQHMMNEIFADVMDQFLVVYLDDILIFSFDSTQHTSHVHEVLCRLHQHGLYAKLEKCEFDVTSIDFVGYVISPTGLGMDPKKVAIIQDWPAPKTVKDVQLFLGFCNFYCMFIESFSHHTAALTYLTCKGVTFKWTDSTQNAFNHLKQEFSSAPLLRHAEISCAFILETDASAFAVSGVLSQVQDDDGLLHPVAFYSHKMTPAEINYEIHDKELLAIIACFKEWCYLLLGAQYVTIVLTDYKNL